MILSSHTNTGNGRHGPTLGSNWDPRAGPSGFNDAFAAECRSGTWVVLLGLKMWIYPLVMSK